MLIAAPPGGILMLIDCCSIVLFVASLTLCYDVKMSTDHAQNVSKSGSNDLYQ